MSRVATAEVKLYADRIEREKRHPFGSLSKADARRVVLGQDLDT
jgi:hypothetical protein